MKIVYKTPLKAAFDYEKVLTGPHFGIELEYEGALASSIDYDALTKWSTVPDHSLRNGGIELVSKPLKPMQVPLALTQAKKAIIDSGAMITKRCGVHIHMNVSDLSFEDLWKVMVYYTAIEPFLFKQFADGREDSHFCVPTWQNTYQIANMWKDASQLYRGVERRPMTSPMMYQPFGGGAIKKLRVPLLCLAVPKYTAMNTSSVVRLGTLEFRMFYGTTDMRKVQRYVNFLHKLREQALSFNSASDIANTLICEGHAALLPEVGLEEHGDINPQYVEDAIDATLMSVGHPPTNHETFDWEI